MDINEEWFNFSTSSSQTFTANASQLSNSNEPLCSKSSIKLEPVNIPKCEEF